MPADATYATVLRRGKRGVIKRQATTSADPKSGIRTETQAPDIKVRRMHKEPTTNTRRYASNMAQQDIGDVTFVMMVREVKRQLPSLRLEQEAHIEWQGNRYEVVSDVVEEESYIVTANILNKP